MSHSVRRIALVTGGSRGIGRAVVLRLVNDGFDVAFCYQRGSEAASDLEKVAAELGGRVSHRQVNVADAAQVREWVLDVENSLGPIDVVVTSAGIVRDGPLVMMPDKDWQDVIDVNLNGTYNVCRAAVFGMLKRKSGCIVNISSVAGVHGNSTQANYSASKAGIIGFTKALSKEVGRYMVRVNAVAPGYIETDMVAGISDKLRSKAVAGVSLGRMGQPDEVADAVSYLVTADYVTGSVLQIDGGLSI
ncbi:3-oxoacyl-ACP reductase FabG [Kitasatospora sp. DSM 101779]|uniref:3-ketoacyl-ACP reductase n=1 Tax=Kitasatospora sp. 152608 TaxID=1769566 RepID=A0A0U3BEG1_9ACTN|nr:3-oxoacyl-ACP reductase FabG [Kitasatospora sp. DSM 101779]ALT05968.1 3-ketoacyl-ACP reductase [Kitasatospora sp. 152608]MCU7825047.1 3-oxoacyl-ACP reductase FabG [Kitasatospora sp. DSM 101779]